MMMGISFATNPFTLPVSPFRLDLSHAKSIIHLLAEVVLPLLVGSGKGHPSRRQEPVYELVYERMTYT